MLRFDSFQLQKEPFRTADGYMILSGRVARAGVLPYRNLDGSTRKELVLPEELQRHDSLGSIALKPVTDQHPQGGRVDASNARQVSRGVSLQKVSYAGGYVELEILVTDEDLVKKIDRGDARDLSLGYNLESLDATPGVHPEYGEYDAIQRGRIANHVAVVPRGRAGPSVGVRVDSADKEDIAFYQDQEDQLMTVENKEEEVKPADAEDRADSEVNLSQSIADLSRAFKDFAVKAVEDRADAEEEDGEDDPLSAVQDAMSGFAEKMDAVKSQADAMQGKHDEMKAQLDALINDITSKNEDAMDPKEKEDSADERTDAAPSMTEADMLTWHRERKALEALAGNYRIDSADDLSNSDLRKQIVTEHFGKERVDGASDPEIVGMFKALQTIKSKRDDSYQSASAATVEARKDSAPDSKQKDYENRMYNSWRGDAAPSGVDEFARKIAEAINAK